MTDTPRSTVLIVEDEPALADTYALWLEDPYAVRTAYDGSTALDQLDGTVDVTLLDRRMAEVSGDEVLATIRDRGLGCQVAMVTAVEPDVDIADMEFDAYLVKPIGMDELEDLVERLLDRSRYDDRIREFYALATRKAILDAEMTERERVASDEYARLDARLAEVRERTDAALEEVFGREEFPDVVNASTNVDIDVVAAPDR
jgi:DNA-binding response OmpR family regulator